MQYFKNKIIIFHYIFSWLALSLGNYETNKEPVFTAANPLLSHPDSFVTVKMFL